MASGLTDTRKRVRANSVSEETVMLRWWEKSKLSNRVTGLSTVFQSVGFVHESTGHGQCSVARRIWRTEGISLSGVVVGRFRKETIRNAALM